MQRAIPVILQRLVYLSSVVGSPPIGTLMEALHEQALNDRILLITRDDNLMPQQLIQNHTDLLPICSQISAAEHIAVDTEFIRQRTFKAQLCLIQIAVDDEIYCIDPLALPDLSPLMNSFQDTEIVIHSARQDIEALFQTTGSLLAPIFDTQIAAGLTGLGDQISYSALVTELLGVDLGKGETRTNWAQRPLSDAQLRYAQDDVRYLLQLYAPLRQLLIDKKRMAWHEAECEYLGDEKLYCLDPDNAWKKVKGTRDLQRPQRRALKRLAAWREHQALIKDKPRKWIISDADIINISLSEPASENELSNLFDSRQNYLKSQSPELFQLLKLAENDPVEEHFAGTNEREIRLTKLGMKLLRKAAEKNQISPALLGTRKDLAKLLNGQPNALIDGWRLELVGKELQQLIAETE